MPNTLTQCQACGALANPSWMTCGACTKPLNGRTKPYPPMVHPEASPIYPGQPRRATPTDWLTAWRELAGQTADLLPDDPRLGPVLSVLATCERTAQVGDEAGFQRAVERVRRLMQFVPGASVRWAGVINYRSATLGPAKAEAVHADDGQLWVLVTWKGLGRWVSERIITQIERPES